MRNSVSTYSRSICDNRQTQGLECERLSARVGRMELELKRLQLYRAVMCTTHLPEAVMPEAVAAARLRT